MAVTDMAPDDVARFGYEPFATLDDAVAAAMSHTGPSPRVLIVHDAALTTMVSSKSSE